MLGRDLQGWAGWRNAQLRGWFAALMSDVLFTRVRPLNRADDVAPLTSYAIPHGNAEWAGPLAMDSYVTLALLRLHNWCSSPPPMHRSHPIRFTIAQGVPEYALGVS